MNDEELTYEVVRLSAVRIRNKGIVPTVENIYDMLAGKGDKKQIGEFLATWQAEVAAEGDSSKEEGSAETKLSDLEESLSLVRATLESTTDAILVTSTEGQMVDYNQNFMAMWHFPPEVLELEDENAAFGYALTQVVDPDALAGLLMSLSSNPDVSGLLDEVLFKDGRIFERYTQPHRVNGEIRGRVWSFRDVTEARKREEALRLRQRAIQSSSQGIAIIDLKGEDQPIVSINPAFERITGYSEEEVIGKNCRFLQGEDREQSALLNLRNAISELREEKVVLRNYRKDGSLFWNELAIAPVLDQDGTVNHYVGILEDITKRKHMEEQLLHNATHDELTLLPNRSLLMDRMKQSIMVAKRTQLPIATLFLDLDNFKNVNDSLGHDMGDELLKVVAGRLSGCMRESDTLARIGGDEFVAVLPELETEEAVIPIAQKVMALLEDPFQVGSNELQITTSMGISFYPKDGESFEDLMKFADISMYHAKDSGRNNFKMYTEGLNQRLVERLALEKRLRRAVDNGEFHLVYQPLVSFHTNQIIGVESLIRWADPEHGIISPMDFIPLAEETGLIVPIGEWVLRTACEQNMAWQKLGFDPITVAVNVSGRQFVDPKLIGLVASILQETALAPHLLEMELTETMLIENGDETIDLLHQLKDMGIRLSIDDFGTGYSSLSYLKQFPVDKLKIDRAFVKDVADDPSDAAITLAIISLGHSLKLDVLAEGIEDGSQLAFLRHSGCDYAQGYYLSRPVPADACTELLDAQHQANMAASEKKA